MKDVVYYRGLDGAMNLRASDFSFVRAPLPPDLSLQ